MSASLYGGDTRRPAPSDPRSAVSTPEQHVLPQSRQPMPGSPEPARPGAPLRSPAQIERDIEARRERLAGTIDALADRVSPKNVFRRKVEEAKVRAAQARERALQLTATVKEQATDKATDEQGKPRPDVLGAAAALALLALVLYALKRRRDA
jgi:MYXO-CTERM domain-containing protein